jgi:hypothetical protein
MMSNRVRQAGSLRPIVNRPTCDEVKAGTGRLPAYPGRHFILSSTGQEACPTGV